MGTVDVRAYVGSSSFFILSRACACHRKQAAEGEETMCHGSCVFACYCCLGAASVDWPACRLLLLAPAGSIWKPGRARCIKNVMRNGHEARVAIILAKLLNMNAWTRVIWQCSRVPHSCHTAGIRMM